MRAVVQRVSRARVTPGGESCGGGLQERRGRISGSRRLRGERHLSGTNLFLHSLGRAATQIVAFLVNAAKGTPVASFIGAPEWLSALTDITSFSSGRVTTYCLLLIFYTVVVMGVVWLCNRLRSFLEHNEATA